MYYDCNDLALAFEWRFLWKQMDYVIGVESHWSPFYTSAME